MSKRKKGKAVIETKRLWSALEPKPTCAFKLGNRSVYGGPGRAMCRLPWAMLLCCSDIVPSSMVYMSEAARKLMPASLAVPCSSPYIRIDWPDQGAPWELERDFWQHMVDALKKVGKPGDIGVSCFGGCGRTGTALAILASLADVVPPGDCPVAFIRQSYWRDAIESPTQGRYIERITGRKVTTTIETYQGAWSHHGNSAYDKAWSKENVAPVTVAHSINGTSAYGTGAYAHGHIQTTKSVCRHNVLLKDHCEQCKIARVMDKGAAAYAERQVDMWSLDQSSVG